MPEDSRPDYLEVEDVAVFEALNNATRLRILRYLDEPRSIREVAELLDVPPTRLYYHFNLLEELGIIEVVETRKVGAMLQKVYRGVAKGFRPSPKMSQGDHEPHELAKATAGVVLDGARVDAEEALTRHFEKARSGDETKSAGSMARSVAFMTRRQAEAFKEKIEVFLEEEFDSHDEEEGSLYSFTYAFFPVAGTDTDL